LLYIYDGLEHDTWEIPCVLEICVLEQMIGLTNDGGYGVVEDRSMEIGNYAIMGCHRGIFIPKALIQHLRHLGKVTLNLIDNPIGHPYGVK